MKHILSYNQYCKKSYLLYVHEYKHKETETLKLMTYNDYFIKFKDTLKEAHKKYRKELTRG